MRYLLLIALFASSLFAVSCNNQSNENAADAGKLRVVCTTGMIRDAVKNIGGDLVVVEALMGPGVDPHLYKATQGDLQKLTDADLILYNGLHLEGKMGEILEKLGRMKTVVAVSEEIPETDLINLTGKVSGHDPHIWFDVSLWQQAVDHISFTLQKEDAENASQYAQNHSRYSEELETLHNWVSEAVQQIPTEQRVMITAHDAFEYFGKAYGIEVRGLQGISTVAEFGLQDRIRLVEFIVERKIKAVFVESSVPPKALEAVVQGCEQQGHQVVIGGTLYSDAMGANNTPEGTYTGMVRSNVNTLVNALK